MIPDQILDGMLWYAAFVISVTTHEAAHAWAALRGGDRTAYLAGQVSLNPVPHMKREPFGMVILPLLSALSQGWCVGWASTPYDPAWERRYPKRAAWMAAAGPGANLLIAVIVFVILKGAISIGFLPVDPELSPFGALGGQFLMIVLLLNVILFLFNLIPFPPLDGATVMMLFVSEDVGLKIRAMLRQPAFAILGLLAAWYLFGKVIHPVLGMVIDWVSA